MKKVPKPGLLLRILIAIALGIACSFFFPVPVVRIFITINDLFGNFLSFVIPLIILGLVAPGIAELGKGAGKLLALTVLIAYASTLFAGFFSYFTCMWTYPWLLDSSEGFESIASLESIDISPYFTVPMPPLMDVMAALLLAFILGIGLAAVKGSVLRDALGEFKEVIVKVINKIIVPLLPIYIFGIFLKMGVEGQVWSIMSLFLKVIVSIFIMHILLLLIQYTVAGAIAKRNPLKMLRTMLPAYVTALGTQSSAATIPVALEQAKKLGINLDIASFVIPLNATIHLSGSILKIVVCAVAIMWMHEMLVGLNIFIGFIMMLGVVMVAAPGVPGGAIMAALGLLQSMLGFDETLQGLMIALYITMDSFGTAGNVTGDGALAVIVDKIASK